MSLPEEVDEEYLDDLIQLIPSDGNAPPDPEGFSYYKQKSYVPVSFFNNERNLRLLNNCRPLRIELVDLKTVKYDDGSDSESKIGQEIDIGQEVEAISVEANQILGKISSNCLIIKRKTNINKVESEKKDFNIDFKKNKGLIGLKVSQTLEVLEIDSEEEESKINKSHADKVNEEDGNVKKNNDNIEMDTAICVDADSVVLDISREITKLFEYDSNCNSATTSIETNTSACCVDSNKGLTGDTPIVSSEIPNTSNVSNNEDKNKPIQLKISTAKKKTTVQVDRIITSDVENVPENKTVENTQKKKDVTDYSISSYLKKDSKHNTNNEESIHMINHAVISENISEVQENNKIGNVNGSESPVFSCTPQNKNIQLCNKSYDTTCFVLNHTKDFNDNRFESKMNSLTNNNQKSFEKNIHIQKSTNDNILGIESVTIVNSNTELEPTKQKSKNHGKNCFIKARTINTDYNIIPHRSNKIFVTADNRDRLNKTCLSNPTCRESLNVNSTAVLQSKTSNNEKIIRIKLNENIDRNTIEKEKIVNGYRCIDKQAVAKLDNIASKLSSQAACYANHNELKTFRNASITFDQNRQVVEQNCSAIVRQDPNNISPGSLGERPQNLTQRLTGLSGQDELCEKNLLVKNKAGPKTFTFVKINPYRRPSDYMPNKLSNPRSEMSIPPSLENKNTNATNVTATNTANALANGVNSDNKTKSAVRETTITESNELNQKRHSLNISEHIKSKPPQNNFAGHQRPISFGPHPRQYVRPMLRNNGTQVLNVGHYPKHGYMNYMNNPNTVAPYPGPGYNNNYNSYWPYLYTRSPQPPLPQPPSTATNSSKPDPSNTPGVVNTPENNKVTVVKQINIKVRPTNELLKNNTDVIDANVNNTSPQNNSPTVVSSKSEMFEELEKEMMSLEHGDLNCTEKKELRVYTATTHNKNDISLDPRRQLTGITLPAIEKSDSGTGKGETKVKNNTKAIKRPSDLKISNESIKKKRNMVSKAEKNKAPELETGNSCQKYSDPILPIPSYQETLNFLTQASNDIQKGIEKPVRRMDAVGSKNTNDKEKIKKISLDEYKNRKENKQLCEKKKRKCEKKKQSKAVKKKAVTKTSDHDQGYDSDTTIIL